MNEKLILPKTNAPRMFDAIALRYDVANKLLSLGQDGRWRKAMARFLPPTQHLKVLDIATGTADVLLTFCQENVRIKEGIGIDLAQEMLTIGQAKIQRARIDNKITLMRGDAQELPFLDNSFECVSVAFGIRNVPDLRRGLLEMVRVLKPEGRVIILEASKPANPILRFGHWLFTHAYVPLIGLLVAGNWKAYIYLAQTIEDFPSGDQFCRILKQFGLKDIAAYPHMGGAVTIYVANK